MYQKFEELDQEKKDRIIVACIEAFSNEPYDQVSTNALVKKIGISKGSLFHYFHSKEDLYFYIVDYAVGIVKQKMTEKLIELPKDLFERILAVAEMEFDLYSEIPVIYKFFKQVFNIKSKYYQVLIKKYALDTDKMFNQLFYDVDTSSLLFSKEVTLNTIKWIFTGFNDYFSNHFNEDMQVNEYKKLYFSEISSYLEIIKKGIINKENKDERN